MLLLGPHAAPCRQLRGDEGVPPWLCATRGRPRLSSPAGACPSELVKCLSGSVPPRATLTCNKMGKKDSCALTCASKARFQPGTGGARGGPHLPAWPKLGTEEQLAEHPEAPSPGMREKECLWGFFLAEFGSSGWVCAAQEPGGGVLGAAPQGLCTPLGQAPPPCRDRVAARGGAQHRGAPPMPAPPSHRVRQQLHRELRDARAAAGQPAETGQQQPAVPR